MADNEKRRKTTKKKYEKSPKLGDTQCVFTPDPGEVEGPVFCGVCGTQMTEKRDCYGPTSSIMAMAGSKRGYDFFECPVRGELWHKQVCALRDKARNNPSGKLRAMFLEEAEEILATKKATVESGLWTLGIN